MRIARALPDAIEHVATYPHPAEIVWEAPTDADQLSAWIMETDFNPAIGARFTFFDHEPWPDGKIYDVACKLVPWDPPHYLAYSWASPPKHGPTLVEWALQATDGGTKVTFRNSGFASLGKSGQKALDMHRDGWGGLLSDELPNYLAQLASLSRSFEVALGGEEHPAYATDFGANRAIGNRRFGKEPN